MRVSSRGYCYPDSLEDFYSATGSGSSFAIDSEIFVPINGFQMVVVFPETNNYDPAITIQGIAYPVRGLYVDLPLPAGWINPGSPYWLTFSDGKLLCPDLEQPISARNATKQIAYNLSPASPLSANAIGYSLVFTPDPVNTGNNRLEGAGLRVIVDQPGASQGAWLEYALNGTDFERVSSTVSLGANIASNFQLNYGDIFCPVRLRIGNGAVSQSLCHCLIAGNPARILPSVVSISVPDIASGTTWYSQEFDSDVDGIGTNFSLFLKSNRALTYAREIKVDGTWLRDPQVNLASLTADVCSLAHYSTSFSNKSRIAIRNSTGATASVSVCKITGRGAGY